MLRVARRVLKGDSFSFSKSVLLDVPRRTVYDTVIDIPCYSKFLPWCNQSHWIANGPEGANVAVKGVNDARLCIKFAMFQESYVSRVTYEPFNYIQAVAADNSLFEQLGTFWKLHEIDACRTRIDFDITLRFHNSVYQGLLKSVRHILTTAMLHHFIKECHRRHQNPGVIACQSYSV